LATKITRQLLEQVDFEQVLFTERHSLNKVGPHGKREFLNIWINEYLCNRISIPLGKDVDYLFFKTLVRNDYRSLFDSVISSVGDHDNVVVSDYVLEGKSPIAENSLELTKMSWLADFISDQDPIMKAALTVRLALHLRTIEAVFSNSFKVLCVFAEMQSVENLAVQLAKLLGIQTVTMQHGLYVDYGSLNTVNVVNYLHHCSDHFLAWGANTERLITRYHPDASVHLCGKPNVYDAADEPNAVEADQAFIYVILDQSIFDEQNYQMLRIVGQVAEQCGLEVFVKFHPINDKSAYYREFPFIREGANISNAQWVIGHTSSLMYEAIVLGYRTLRFATDVPALEVDDEINFHSSEELLELIERSNIAYDQLSKELIASRGNESIACYRTSLLKVLEVADV